MAGYHFFPALVIATTLTISAPIHAANGTLTEWRGLKFGMSMAQAKKALSALPKAGPIEEKYGDPTTTLDDLEDSASLYLITEFAYTPWTIRIQGGYQADPSTLESIWLSTEKKLIGDGISLIHKAKGAFEELLTALALAYGPPDMLITSFAETSLAPSVGRALWHFENGASLIAIGYTEDGAFRPEIGFIAPLNTPPF